jgi:hypothetical protein
MPFQKGISGNITGRPTGSKNKAGEGLRILLSDFLERKFEQVINDFEQLEPKDRIKVFTDLLQYSVPKLQAVSNSIEFEKMTDEQLDDVIKQLMQTHESN